MLGPFSFSRLPLSLLSLSAAGCTLLINRELDSKPAHVARQSDSDAGDQLDGGEADAASSLDAGADATAANGDAGSPTGDAGGDGGGTMPSNGKVKLCVGASHACGLSATGSVTCWGSNDVGQTSLPMARAYQEIACGDAHTCGIDSKGAVVCVGHNIDGQRVNLPGPFTAVAAGDSHTCLLDTAGKATCYGPTGSAQISAPNDVFTSLTAGTAFTCGIRAGDAALVCWGSGASGFNVAAAGKKLVSIDAGPDYVCGVTDQQEGFCWGNTDYQPPPLGKVTQISGGYYSGCAVLTDRSVHCWYGGAEEKAFGDKGPFVLVSVGGDGRCAIPEHGSVLCEPTDGSAAIAPGPKSFP